MKKLLFISILFFSTSLMAQNESAVASENSFLIYPADYSVVRNWNDNYSLSSHLSMGGTYFVKTEFGMINATTGSIANYLSLITDSIQNLNVMDMRIVDEYAFICGNVWDSVDSITYITHGFLGYFNIRDMIQNHNMSIKLHVYDSIREFGRMVAYQDTGGYKIVALGSYREYYPYNNNTIILYPTCLVEDYIMTFVPSIQIQKIQPFNSYGTPREIMTDLVLVDDYVVLVGRLHYPSSPIHTNYSICVRYANKQNVIGDPMLNIHYYFKTPSPEVNGDIIAVALDKKNIAVSYVNVNNNTDEFYTRLRVIEIPSMKMFSSQQFKTYSKDEPIEMAYDPENDILTLLHPMPFQTPFSYNYSYFVQIKPYSIDPYPAPVLYPQNGLYTSLDMFNDQFYVATGQNWWYYQHTTAPQPNVNRCPQTKEINIEPIPNLDAFSFSGHNTISTTYHETGRSTVIKSTKIIHFCNDK